MDGEQVRVEIAARKLLHHSVQQEGAQNGKSQGMKPPCASLRTSTTMDGSVNSAMRGRPEAHSGSAFMGKEESHRRIRAAAVLQRSYLPADAFAPDFRG